MATPEQVDDWFRKFGFNPAPRQPAKPSQGLAFDRDSWAEGALEIASEAGISLDEAHRRLARAFPELYQ